MEKPLEAKVSGEQLKMIKVHYYLLSLAQPVLGILVELILW